MTKRFDSQKKKVFNHLFFGKTITPIEALKLFGAFRLSAIIYDLKQDGYDIKTTIINNGEKRYAQYNYTGYYTEPAQKNLG